MQLQQLLEAMIAYMGGDARRIQHFIKVHALAQLIGRQEQLNERTQFILEAADSRYRYQKWRGEVRRR